MITISTTHRCSVHYSNSCGITGWIFSQIRSRNFDTGWVLCHISVVFSGFLSNHEKALLRWLLHLHAKFQPIPSRSLSCRRDRPLTFYYVKNRL